MKKVTQEAPMGCAIACAASLVSISYKKMRSYFNNGKIKEYTIGFYNRDIVSALNKVQIQVKVFSIGQWKNKIIRPGTIVFIGRSKFYPSGHYLLKTKHGWMNPWINFPNINPALAGFQKRLSGKIKWIIQVYK